MSLDTSSNYALVFAGPVEFVVELKVLPELLQYYRELRGIGRVPTPLPAGNDGSFANLE